MCLTYVHGNRVTHTKTISRLMNCSGEEEIPKSGTPKSSLNSHLVNQRGKLVVEALQLLRLLLSDPLDFRVHLHIQELQEVPVDLHKVSTSTFAHQPIGAPASLTSPEPRTNTFPSLCVLENLAMAPGSIASPKQCPEAKVLLQPRVNTRSRGW